MNVATPGTDDLEEFVCANIERAITKYGGFGGIGALSPASRSGLRAVIVDRIAKKISPALLGPDPHTYIESLIRSRFE